MKEVRPTTGIALQALFNILGDVRGRAFLDLFSGTGRVAFEACKRGASPVVSVELLRARSKEIWKKKYDGHTHLSMDVRKGLSWVSRREMVFDFIFADPPYESGWTESLPELVSNRSEIFSPGGIFIMEHAKSENVVVPATMFLEQERVYGRSKFSFMKLKEEKES